MLIIISGMPGSGKSTVAKYASKYLGLDYISAGTIFRNLSVKKGYDKKGDKFIEWNRYVKDNPVIDKEIDKEILKRAKKGNVVVDSWLGGHLIKKADLKIFLKIDMKSAVQRISLREEACLEDVKSQTNDRLKLSKERWKKLYGVDVDDLRPFDFVFDTTKFSQEQMKEVIRLVLKTLFKGDKK